MKAVDNNSAPRAAIEQAVSDLAADASLEVTPARVLDGATLANLLPPQTPVYLPFLPRGDFADTVNACRRLIAERLIPVPHLTPRAVGSRKEMRAWLAALRDAGVDRMLLIAGDRPRPAGPYASTLDLLDSGLLLDYGFRRFGIAGHPEGHPELTPAALDHALALKRDYAATTGSELWIVTQFVFGSDRIVPWLRSLRHTTNAAGALPVRVGFPGPATLPTLIAYAAHCGVSASARVLRQRPDAARLLTGWTPDGLLRDLAYYRLAEPLFAGIHVYPFGGVARCHHWLQALRTDGTASDAAGVPPA